MGKPAKREPPAQRTVADGCWRETLDGIELVARCCLACGQPHLPAPLVCARCGGTELRECAVRGRGTIYAVTLNHVPAPGYPSPYAIAFVEYPENLRVFGPVSLEGRAPRIGDAVEVDKAVLHRDAQGTRAIGYRFVVVDG